MSILCSMVGASFTVAAVAQVLRSKKGITAFGNAQVDTAQSKFGGSSLLLDGTGDYLSSTTPLSIGTGDWTVELWLRTGTANRVFFDNRIPTASAGVFFLSASGFASYYDNTTGTISGTTNCADSIFRHLAFSKSGTTLRIFVNGTVEYTATGYTQDMGTDRSCIIGAQFDVGLAINGHIDEFRISNSARYTANFTAPTQPFANDNNTLFLMHANGTDGTTFFEDDNGGRSPVPVIAFGNAQVSTAQSKFGGSSALFDGTGDYLFSPSNTVFEFTTADFTLEGWFRFINFTNGPALFDLRAAGGTEVKPLIYCGSDGVIYYYVNGAARITGNTLSANTWYHIAVSRSAGVTKLFRDGTQIGSNYTDTNNYPATVVSIGIASWNTSFNALNGYADEIRISNSARYTANFTAPTTAFVNDANTVLLIHADGTNASTVFRDDNGIIGSTPKVLSPQGNTQISTAQSKFGASSAYFDGTGDYLRLGQPGNFNFGSDNWTIEGFIRPTNNLSGYKVVYNHNDNGTDRSWITIQLENSTLKSWGTVSTSSWSIYSDLSFGTLTVDTWHHFALVRDGSTMRAFLNGTQINTASCTGWVIPAQTAAATLSAVPASYFYGWMDGIRISNTARYGASGYTTPTSAFTQDSNTLMLLNFEGTNASTTFIDSSGRTQKGVSAIGNAQVSTAQSKFGGASSLYDGTGDYIQLANSNDFNFGSGNWTAEFWWYQPSNVAAGIYPTLIAFGILNSDTGFLISSEPTTNKVNLISSSTGSDSMSVVATSGNLSAATWNHVAVVVNSSVTTIYVNGTASGAGYATRPKSSTGQMYIGGGLGGLSSGTLSSTSATTVNLNGYLDEVRISNIARYTATFTPSTTPFQNDDNTILLLHMDGTNASTAFFDDNGAKPYTP